MSESDWDTIDAALIRLRRVLALPRQTSPSVDLSAVLVVDTIARRAARGERTRIVDIASQLSVAPSTASRLVAATLGAGYIERSPSADDPRSVILLLTPSGEELTATAKRFRIGFLQRATVGWDEQTIATFAKLLHEFSSSQPGRDASTNF